MHREYKHPDVYVSKFGPAGNREWTRLIGDVQYDYGNAVTVLADGSIVVVGSTQIGSFANAYLVKLSPEGSVLWTRNYGDSTSFEEFAAILPMADGGFIAAGTSGSSAFPGDRPGLDAFVVRLDANGNVIWTKLMGGSGTDRARAICKLGLSYYIAGETNSADIPKFPNITDSKNMYLARFNESGQILNQLGVGTSNTDVAKGIACISGGPQGDSVVLVGQTYNSAEGDYNLLISQVNSAVGILQWQNVSGNSSKDEIATSIVRDPLYPNYAFVSGEAEAGGFIFPNQGGNTDGFVLRVDLADGKIRWRGGFGGSTEDTLNSISIRSDGYIFTAGSTESSDIDSINQGMRDVYMTGFLPSVPPTDTTAPNFTGTLTVENYGCKKVMMEWPHLQWSFPVPANEAGLNHYAIYVNGILKSVTQGQSQKLSSSKRNFEITDLQAGSSYSFAVSAVDRAGNESQKLTKTFQLPASSSSVCTDTSPPSTPNAQIFQDSQFNACNKGIQIPITGGADIGASGLMEYRVYRNGVGPTRIPTTFPQFHYKDFIGRFPGKTYSYDIESVDFAGNVSPRRTVSLDMPVNCGYPDTQPKQIKLAVLPVQPANETSPPHLTPAKIADMINGIGGRFNSFGLAQYIDEISHGTQFLTLDFIPSNYVRLPNNSEEYCNFSGCDTDLIMFDAIGESGIRPNEYDVILLVAPSPEMPMNSSNPSASELFTNQEGQESLFQFVSQELMHSGGILGIANAANSALCPGSSTKLGSDPLDPLFGCIGISPTGDSYSGLGSDINNSYHIPVYMKALKKFLSPEQTITLPYQGQSSVSTFTLEAAETRTTGLKQILVPLGRTNYNSLHNGPVLSLEYRTPQGFNNNPHAGSALPVQGVQVRLIPWLGVIDKEAETLFLSTLPIGTQPFNYNDVRVEVLQGDMQSASVRISRY
ncbi:hypothetical protein AB3N59_06515 [Leptospira sp. WS92.C1]